MAHSVQIIGLRGAPKISVLRGSHCTVRVSIREFRISVRFVLYIALSKQQWWRWKIIFPLRLAIVNDIIYETFTATDMLIPWFLLLISSYAKR